MNYQCVYFMGMIYIQIKAERILSSAQTIVMKFKLLVSSDCGKASQMLNTGSAHVDTEDDILPLTTSTSQLPRVPSGTMLKKKGAALGSASSSKAVTNTVFLSEHRLLWVLVRVGQWSLESATLMAIVPVAVLGGMSEKEICVSSAPGRETTDFFLSVCDMIYLRHGISG